MQRPRKPKYDDLVRLLANPELFDPREMPKGRPYLHSGAKTILDAILSLSVIPITGIPTLAGAAAVKLLDHEAPVFTQRRVGLHGSPFTIFKLRTMPGHPEDTHSNGRHDDPRRSDVGRVLSLLRIDESLQLRNVAQREMSIIGPRPLLSGYLERVKYLIGGHEADEWIKIRSLALPGIFDEYSNMHHGYKITGDPAEQLRLRIATESEYILETASVQEDLRVLGHTVALLGETLLRHSGIPHFARKDAHDNA